MHSPHSQNRVTGVDGRPTPARFLCFIFYFIVGFSTGRKGSITWKWLPGKSRSL
jgi:hypothetical protein